MQKMNSCYCHLWYHQHSIALSNRRSYNFFQIMILASILNTLILVLEASIRAYTAKDCWCPRWRAITIALTKRIYSSINQKRALLAIKRVGIRCIGIRKEQKITVRKALYSIPIQLTQLFLIWNSQRVPKQI